MLSDGRFSRPASVVLRSVSRASPCWALRRTTLNRPRRPHGSQTSHRWGPRTSDRFSIACPEIDVRVSSSINNTNFTTDGVDAAIRNLGVDAAHDDALEVEKLLALSLMPVCSPALVEKHGPFTSPDMLRGVPLIHDDSFSSRAVMPNWADWFAAAGVRDADVSRGLRFNSADHALDATVALSVSEG
jgi:LysR family glycine cleavage system transcriptional activator